MCRKGLQQQCIFCRIPFATSAGKKKGLNAQLLGASYHCVVVPTAIPEAAGDPQSAFLLVFASPLSKS